jgi:hypothetical protein
MKIIALVVLTALSMHLHAEDNLEGRKPFVKESEISDIVITEYRKEKTIRVEQGEYKSVPYRVVYNDYSAKFAGTPGNTLSSTEKDASNWVVTCSIDEIDDSKRCGISRGDLYIAITQHTNLTVNLWSPKAGILLKPVFLRFDDRKAYENFDQHGLFSKDDSVKIVDDLRKSSKMIARYSKMSSGIQSTETWPVYGFEAVYQYVQYAFATMYK